jgi:hypothetical protein
MTIYREAVKQFVLVLMCRCFIVLIMQKYLSTFMFLLLLHILDK